MSKIYRQGDVLLVKVDALELEAKDRWGNRVNLVTRKDNVVAAGEATGHHHRVVGQAEVLAGRWDTVPMFVRVAGPSQLVHEEHARIDLEEGVYRVVIQREYSPESERRVYD